MSVTDETARPEPESGDARPVAHAGDLVVGIDIHIVEIPSPGGPVPTPLPHPFKGKLDTDLVSSVKVEDQDAAVVDSIAKADPQHVPQGGPFKKEPKHEAKVKTGSSTVLIEDKQAARAGDTCWTCNDPVDLPTGIVVASGSVVVGDHPPPERPKRP